MRTFSHWRSISVCLVLLGAARCASSDASATKRASSQDEGTTADPGGGFSSTSGSGGGSNGVGLGAGGTAVPIVEPEKEVEKAFEAPVATGKYVWAANPKTGRVALINSETFQVKTVAAGEGPTYITAIPGDGDKAIVINVLSSDATYLSQAAGANGQEGKLEQRTYGLFKGSDANSWAVSPDGHFAIAWTDVSRVVNPRPLTGFQAISIIDLTGTGPAVTQSVGYRPSSIAFAADPPRAFAVTDDGISVVDLAMPNTQVKLIKYPEPSVVIPDPPAQPDAGADATTGGDAAAVNATPVPIAAGKADVSITPEGAFAIIRRDRSPFVDVVDLANDTNRWSWKLTGSITDLDLAETGKSAIAVVRSSSSISVLQVPGTAQTLPSEISIANALISSVVIAPLGKTALLFTNAVPDSHLTVLNLDDHKYDVKDLHAPVLSVFPSSTAEHAIVVHDRTGQLANTPGAFSVVPLTAAASPVIQTTDAQPLSVAISPAGDLAIIPARDTAKHIYLTYLAHMSSGIVDRYELASPPTAAGFVGKSGQAFIAQDHPEGRVAFIDPASGKVRTITGFELGASVIEWSPRDGGSK